MGRGAARADGNNGAGEPSSAPSAAASEPVAMARPSTVMYVQPGLVMQNGPFGHSSGWAIGADTGLKGSAVAAGAHVLMPLTSSLAIKLRAYLILDGTTNRPAGEGMVEGVLRSPVIHQLMRFYATLGFDMPFLTNKLTSTTFVKPAPSNLFFIGGNTGWEFFQDGSTVYFIEIGWWGGYAATRFSIPTTTSLTLHPQVGSGPLVNGGVRWYF
jgi:hypothetical protein